MRVPRYAIIPTHNRHEQLISLLRQLVGQVDLVYVIDNAGDEPLSALWLRMNVPEVRTIVHRDDEQPPHLYKMWNYAFNIISTTTKVMGEQAWDVAVFNDDTSLPPGWYDYVADGLRKCYPALGGGERCPAVCSTYAGDWGTQPMIKDQIDGNIMNRMCPWAFVVRGELDLRADESMRWWWGDTDFEWQAIRAGGVLVLPGTTPINTLANSTTHGALAEQAGRDGETFALKWGRRPW